MQKAFVVTKPAAKRRFLKTLVLSGDITAHWPIVCLSWLWLLKDAGFLSNKSTEDTNSAAAVRFNRTLLGLTKSLVQHGLLGLLLFVVVINQRGMRKPERRQRNVTNDSASRQKWFQAPALSLTSGCWPRAAAAPWSPAGWWRTASARRRRLPTGPSIPVRKISFHLPVDEANKPQQNNR